MGKVMMNTNIRVKAQIEVLDEQYQNIIDTHYDGNLKALEKECKKDLIRALQNDLGFEEKEINVTKFEFTYVPDAECEAPVEEIGAELVER